MKFYNEKFKAIREHRNITIKELTIALSRHRRTIWAWEKGIQNPGLSDLKELSKILHVPIGEISDIKTCSEDIDQNSVIGKNLNSPLSIEDRGYLKSVEEELNALKSSLNYAKNESLELQKIVNNLQTLIYRKDLHLKFIFANKAFLLSVGMEKYKVLGNSNINLFSGTYSNVLNNLEKRVLSGEKITNHEVIIPGTKGQRKGYFYGNPIYDEDGKISGIAVSIEDITDKSIAIERYRELEEAVNLSHDILWIKEKKKTNSFSFISQAIDRVTGYKVKDLHNNAKFWLNRIVHPNYKEKVHQYNQSRNWGKPIDYKIITADGKTKYMREKCYFENDLTFGIIEDRTEKMKSEKYQAMLLDIINKVPYSIWISSEFGTKLDVVTEYYSRYINITQKNLVEQPKLYTDFIHPDDVEIYVDWKDSLNSKQWWSSKTDKTKTASLRYRIIGNSKTIWVEEQIFSDPSLRKLGIRYGIITDITDRIENVASLKVVNSVINKLDELIWICTPPPNSKYLFISDGVEKIFGKSADYFRRSAKKWLDFVHPEDMGLITTAIKKGEFPFYLTFRIVRPDNSIIQVQSSTFRSTDDTGRTIDFGVIRKINRTK